MGSLENFMQNMSWAGLTDFLLSMAAVLICLTVHEMSHGLAAYLLGDPTAKRQKRLSLNPLRHLDLFGTLMMLVAGFGWAKPVPVDMRYFRHPKSGMAITALAGPLSNFVLAYLALLTRTALIALFWDHAAVWRVLEFLATLAIISVGLGLFNLLPIPPLDGSKILEGVLPDEEYERILRYENYGVILLVAILWSGIFDEYLWLARSFVVNSMAMGTEWLYNLLGAPI